MVTPFLLQVACWCIGEYGAALLDGISIEGETLTVSEDEVIEVYQKILWAKHMSLVTKQYALMSVTKLSTRFPRATPKIQQIIDAFGSHIDTDLQQRGVEFSALFRHYDGMRAALLEPMPAFEKESSSASQSSSMQDLGHVATNGLASTNDGGAADLLGNFGSPMKNEVGSSLLDIIGSGPSTGSQPAKTDNLLDLLEGLDFGSGPSSTVANNSSSLAGGMNNLFSTVPSTAPIASHNILEGLMNTQPNIMTSAPTTSVSNNLVF